MHARHPPQWFRNPKTIPISTLHDTCTVTTSFCKSVFAGSQSNLRPNNSFRAFILFAYLIDFRERDSFVEKLIDFSNALPPPPNGSSGERFVSSGTTTRRPPHPRRFYSLPVVASGADTRYVLDYAAETAKLFGVQLLYGTTAGSQLKTLSSLCLPNLH